MYRTFETLFVILAVGEMTLPKHYAVTIANNW